jgi:hypothetical protein
MIAVRKELLQQLDRLFSHRHGIGFDILVYGLFTPPCSLIDDQGKARVVKPQLQRDARLGHARHASEIGAVPLESIYFGRGFQAWPLRYGAYATVMAMDASGRRRR